MEEEIKITLVPKEQINENTDRIRITCGNIVAWGETLADAMIDFDAQRKTADCAVKTVTA